MIVHFCDICHKEIKNAAEGYYLILKSAVVVEQQNPFLIPQPQQPQEHRSLICAPCTQMVGKAILGKTPETRIQVVMGDDQKAVLLSERDVLMTPALSIILSPTLVQKKVIEYFAEATKANGKKENPTATPAV